MRGDPIHGSNTIARYCPFNSLDESGKPTSSSFSLRKDEPYLSANSLELAGGESLLQQLDRVRIDLETVLQLGAQARIATLNVDTVLEHVFEDSEDQRRLKVLHEPPPDSHCGIHNTREDDLLVEVLISECVNGIYPASGS